MELNLPNAESVHGEARFVASVIVTLKDFERKTAEELRTADVENNIVGRFAADALELVKTVDAVKAKDAIRSVYTKHRIGSPGTHTTQLFFPTTNVLGLAFNLIAAVKELPEVNQAPLPNQTPPNQPPSNQHPASGGLGSALGKGGGKGGK